jgi:iron complex outermembrane recepter protein
MATQTRALFFATIISFGSFFTLNAQETPPAKPEAPYVGPKIAVDDPVIELERFVTEERAVDPNNLLTKQPIGSAIGFARKLEETPRSISVISSELVDKIGIRDGDQLFRILPGTYTVNRWGIAGATQIRNNTTDTYLRGMKRIDPQGNIRNVITMWDSVEVVRGPPSPIYGNGRIGGYTNYVPKSVRGTTGKYLDKPKGSITLIGGSYERGEVQINYSHPLRIRGRDAGIQVFALLNDSDSYYELNFQKDRVLQTSFSWNINDRWRLEAGAIWQNAQNSGMAGANRVTQLTLDNGTYLRGTALTNLDLDGDGRVSEGEIQFSRNQAPNAAQNFNNPYYNSAIGTSNVNRPLSIVFPFVPGGRPAVAGVPKIMQDLLRLPQYAAAAATPAGQAILNAPTGGPLAFTGTSGTTASATQLVPLGYFLNPATVRYDQRDWSLTAVEELADGDTYTGYLDFIDDADSDKTQKLQLFYDYQHQAKRSQLPFNQDQEISVVETKYTVTRRGEDIPLLNKLPEWFSIDLLGSINIRYTDGGGVSTSGDYDHRRDLVTGYLATDTFTSYLYTGDRSWLTGEPISGATFSDFTEYGIGSLADIKLWERLGLLFGARMDYIQAQTVEDTRLDRSGINARFGDARSYLPRREAEGDDHSLSISGSVNYKLPWAGATPYFTAARASAILANTRQDLAYGNVLSGNLLGEATLIEAGLKGSVFKDRLYYSIAAYDQTRTSSVLEEGESFIRSTVNRGIETELRWLPNKHWSFILSGTFTKVERIQLAPGTFRSANATAKYIGFQDITDAAGNVIFPAEAFLWGGNAAVAIPASATDYNEYGQYPDHILGSFVGYTWDNGFGVTWNSTYVSKVAASSELKDLLTLPDSYSHNISIFYDKKEWRISLNVRNVTDELYWTPNNGSAGGTLLIPALPRNVELSLTRRF